MIELAKANPDVETLKLILWVFGAIIALLLTVIGYFIQQKFSTQNEEIKGKEVLQKDQMEKLASVVDTLSKAVTNIEKIVEVIQQQQAERDPRTERRLNEHSCEIKELDSRVTKVETKCSINH